METPTKLIRSQLYLSEALIFGGLAAIVRPTAHIPVILFAVRFNPKIRAKMIPSLKDSTATPSYKQVLKNLGPQLRKTHFRLFTHWAIRLGTYEVLKNAAFQYLRITPETGSTLDVFGVSCFSGIISETVLKLLSIPTINLAAPKAARRSPFHGLTGAFITAAPMLGLSLGTFSVLQQQKEQLIINYSYLSPWVNSYAVSLPLTYLNGYVASCFGEFITFPLDDSRRIQGTISIKKGVEIPLWEVFQKNLDHKGFFGMWKGCTGRMKMVGPNYAQLLLFYEIMRASYYLIKEQQLCIIVALL